MWRLLPFHLGTPSPSGMIPDKALPPIIPAMIYTCLWSYLSFPYIVSHVPESRAGFKKSRLMSKSCDCFPVKQGIDFPSTGNCFWNPKKKVKYSCHGCLSAMCFVKSGHTVEFWNNWHQSPFRTCMNESHPVALDYTIHKHSLTYRLPPPTYTVFVILFSHLPFSQKKTGGGMSYLGKPQLGSHSLKYHCTNVMICRTENQMHFSSMAVYSFTLN